MCGVVKYRMNRCCVVTLMSLILMSPLQMVEAYWNANSQEHCDPALCSQENSCYCKDYLQGWGGGGAPDLNWGCYILYYDFPSISSQSCQCKDCGSGADVCGNTRCDAEFGVFQDGQCYYDDGSGRLTPTSETFQPNCYQTQVMCSDVASNCPFGTYLHGCKRVSAGSCVTCPTPLPSGYRWVSPGSCDSAQCSVAQAGFYYTANCSANSDAAILPCSQHEGNTDATVLPASSLASAMYYCPGGGRVLAVPNNARVTSDYTGFICNDGYYAHGQACFECLPGYACRSGNAYQCPENYYTDSTFQTACSLCTMTCSGPNVPLRCAAGSNQNARCVSCNACGSWPETGFDCVIVDETSLLASTCTPCNIPVSSTSPTVAVCSENGCVPY